MSEQTGGTPPGDVHQGLFDRLRRRGVVRVAVSYAVIGWLLLQIGDVVLEPLDAPAWVMRALIVLVTAGLPVSIVLAWYFELGPTGITVDHLPERAARPHARGLRRYADAIIMFALLGIIAVLLARQEGWLEPEDEPPVIAVLPFSEIGATEQGPYGDGLADTLTHRLGQLAGLVVLASSSTFEFRGPGLDLQEVARKLGADSILEGSLQRAGGVLRVNARLVEPATGQQQWSGSFNRRAEDLFAVQAEMANDVANALRLVLTPVESARLVKRDTLNLSAFDAYQRAREGLARRDEQGMQDALRHLFAAVESDPGFALAHAALAEAYVLASAYRRIDTDWSSVAKQAREAADKALELDPELGEAYLAQAMVARTENDNAGGSPPHSNEHIASLLEQAVEYSPNNAMAWKFYSEHADTAEKGLERLQKAAQLDPRSGIIRTNIAGAYASMGEVEKSRQWYVLALGTAEPYFEIALESLIGSYWAEPEGLPMAARWGRAFAQAYPESTRAWRDYCLTLLELQALDEVARELDTAENLPALESGVGLLFRLGIVVRLHRSRDDLQSAARDAERFEHAFRLAFAGRSEATGPGGPVAAVLDVIALDHLGRGEAARALEHYQRLFPDGETPGWGSDATEGINGRMLQSAARKQLGDRPAAERELRAYLAEVAPLSVAEVGFEPFAMHAFLGETDAALAALKKAIDAGFSKGWWGLRDGAFDPEFAAVLGDPRFLALFGELERRIAAARDSYLADPGLPLETLLAAGLEPRESGSE